MSSTKRSTQVKQSNRGGLKDITNCSLQKSSMKGPKQKLNQRKTQQLLKLGKISPRELSCSPDTVSSPSFEDENHDEETDALKCLKYIDDIFANMHLSETAHQLSQCDYIETVQDDINSSMRAVLIDWLVSVSVEYQLMTETLYLSKCYLDRYLTVRRIKRDRLQLLGITCLFVASKYEEIVPPVIDDFVFICDDTYTRNEIIQMEQLLLNTLHFNLCIPTECVFLSKFYSIFEDLLDDRIIARLIAYADYYSELTLQEYEFVKYKPSVIAVSSVILALNKLESSHLFPIFLDRNKTKFSKIEVEECCSKLCYLIQQEDKLVLLAVRNKYQPRLQNPTAVCT